MVTSEHRPTGSGAHGSTECPAGQSDQTINDICDFLATAPAAIKPWAEARAQAVRDGDDEALNLLKPSTADSDGSSSSGISPSSDDPAIITPDSDAAQSESPDPEAALAELGESDEAVYIKTPQDRPARPHPKTGSRMSTGTKAIIAVIAVLAVIVGIWMVGQPSSEPEQTAEQTQADDPAQMQARILDLEKLKSEQPDNLDIFLELGLLYFNYGDLDNAQANWEHVTESDPDNIQAWYNLGFLYLSLEPAQTDNAEHAWDRVVEIDPESPLAQTVRNHMDALLHEGNADEGD
ncbi:MAG: tetratricopeptide repeat protein [Actinomycetaceae bacterium]|nr:tetratricopeptide repeat protein [Actinomycetaceae bacterium]